MQRLDSPAGLEGAGSSEEAVEGTSVCVVAEAEGLAEEGTVDDAPLDSIREDALAEGVGSGVDVIEACREALSRVVEGVESSEELSSCRRTAA